MSPVRFGIDQFLTAMDRPGSRLGLVTNDAARLAREPDVPSRGALMRAGAGLARLFSPEHGLGANAADGVAVGDGVDSLTGLPVTSLYGNRMRPEPKALAGLDAMLFDCKAFAPLWKSAPTISMPGFAFGPERRAGPRGWSRSGCIKGLCKHHICTKTDPR